MPGLYRPSASLRLQVRVDEGRATAGLLKLLEAPSTGDTSQLGKPSSGVAADAPAEIQIAAQTISTLNKLDQLTGGADPAIAAELARVLATKRDLSLIASPSGQPDAISGHATDGLSITIGSLPVMRSSIARSSFRTGDKCSFELNYFDAPFNPVLIRHAAVELSIDIISAEEHDAGIHGLRRADGTRYSVVEDLPGATRATRFLGFVSKWDVEFTDSGPVVSGEAQDLMCILRTEVLPPDVEIDHDLPIEQGIKAMLESFPALRGITVAFGPPGSSEVGPAPAGAAARRKKTVKKGKKRIRRNAENTNIWDHITDVCVGIGCIPVIDGVVLRIQRARTLFGSSPDAPRMVWGQNLSALKFSRSMESQKQPTVEVRSYSPDLKRTLAARYPDPHKEGVQRLGDPETPRKPKVKAPSTKPPAAAEQAAAAQAAKQAELLAAEQARVKQTKFITLEERYAGSDYAAEILGEEQTRFDN